MSQAVPPVDAPSIRSQRPGISNEQKTKLTLDFMTGECRRFRLISFLQGLFQLDSSDRQISKTASNFLNDGEHITVMDMWWNNQGGNRNKELVDWVIAKAAEVCAREASRLTNRASAGPYATDAASLRVAPDNVTVDMVNKFSLHDLNARYERTLPRLQAILKAVIVKQHTEQEREEARYRDEGRTFVTSILLNLRSRATNYHATINSLIFWDFQVPKRLHQMFNHLGVSTSYSGQTDAVEALRYSSIELARRVANDPSKIKMLPYDNFNWTSKKAEATALHANVTHDEVSALLVVLPNHSDMSATDITSSTSFEANKTYRHDLHRGIALNDILPSADDHETYRLHAITHVQEILAEEVSHFSQFRGRIPPHQDPRAINPMKTEEYYLPTFDQEQGSTRGNMIVLSHYFRDVLGIPTEVFEKEIFTILGDRLTTSRDRAAQDQRALDRSDHAIDHLSCFKMVNGLMHTVLNYIEGIGNNYWGGDNADAISLLTVRNVLPNRSQLNLKKVDYYGWLRFLDVTLRALVIKGAMTVDGLEKLEDFGNTSTTTYEGFEALATTVVDQFILPTQSQLEISDRKTLEGNTMNTHAVLLAQDLTSLREMQDAIKHGHPTRILRTIKFWTPAFYAAGRYNYAHECMELLHNIIHDWPSPYAEIAFNGMLVNPSGKPDGFKPTDLHVEHLNCRIKERAHGTNATPELLEKITPIMGHVRQLSNQVSDHLGVEARNQKHTHVRQHKDVEILSRYLISSYIFDFTKDQPSNHAVVDLYSTGILRLAGKDGGHARHLNKHKLRLRTRHSASVTPEAYGLEELSRDSEPLDFYLGLDTLENND